MTQLEGVKVGDRVKLIPRTRHAKNRVREHGDIVEVCQIKSDQFCCMHLDGDQKNPDIWRWGANDDDFDWDWTHAR